MRIESRNASKLSSKGQIVVQKTVSKVPRYSNGAPVFEWKFALTEPNFEVNAPIWELPRYGGAPVFELPL
jgi:hypothetical protein